MPWEDYREEGTTSTLATLPPQEAAPTGPWTEFASPQPTPEPETDSWAEVLGKSVMQGLTFVPLSLGALMRFNDELLGRDPIPGELYDISKQAREFWEPQVGRSAPKRHAANILRTVSEMGSTLAVTGGAGLLPGVSVGAGAHKYVEAREEGASVGRAAAAGTVQGGIEAATELIPLGILLKPGLTFGRRLAMGAITDLPGELIATASEMSVVDSLILGKHYTHDQYIEALKDTAIVSLGVTGLMTAGTHPLIRAIEQVQADLKQTEQEAIVGPSPEEGPVSAPPEQALIAGEMSQKSTPEPVIEPTPEEAALVDSVIEGTDLETAESAIPPSVTETPIAATDETTPPLIEAQPEPTEDMPIAETGPIVPEETYQAASQRLAESTAAAQTYRGPHKAPGLTGYGTPSFELTPAFPDIYGPEAMQLYGDDTEMSERVLELLRKLADKPTAKVKVYRAVPQGVEEIHAGDWVTLDREYAEQHGQATLGPDAKIIRKNIHANELFTDGNSLFEWGYAPQVPIDPSSLSDLVIIGAYQVERGAKTFPVWSTLMRQRFGDAIAQNLRTIWKQSKDYLQARVLDRNTKQRVREQTGQVSVAQFIREDQAMAAAWKKAEQSARIAFRSGNKAGVATEKARMLEIIQQAKHRAAGRAKTAQDIQVLKRLQEKAEGAIALDYQQKISDLLGQLDLAKPTDETIERLRGLRDFLDREGVPLGISQAELNQLERLSKTPIRELSGTARAEIVKTAQKLYKLGKLKQTLKESQRLREQTAARDRLVASTVNLDPVLSGQKQPTKADIYKVGAVRLSMDVMHTFRTADLADGAKDYTGEHAKMIKDQMRAEITAKNEAQRRTKNALAQIQALGVKELTPEMSQRITIGLMVEQGARGQVQTLLKTYGFEAIPELTPTERQIMHILQTEAGAKTEHTRAVFEQRENLPFTSVEHYFPIKYESDFAIAPAETINQNRYRTKESEQGFTLERVPGVTKVPRIDVLAVLEDAMLDQEWYLHLQPILDQQAALVRTPEYRAASGDLLWTWWKDQIDIVARKGWSATARANPVLRQVRLNLNQAVLGYKLSTIMMQPFAVFEAMSYAVSHFGPRAGLDIALHFTKAWVNPPAALRFAQGSPALRLRQAGEIAVEETLKQAGGLGGLRQALVEGAFAGIRMSDIITASGVEQGILATLKRHGIPNAEVEADFLMNVVSGSSEVTTRPHLLARGEGVRTWLTFQSFLMNRWDIITHDLIRAGFRGNWKRRATAMLGLAILMAGGLAEDEAREKLLELTTGNNSTISDEALLKKLILYVPRQIPAIGGVFEKWGRAEPPAVREVEKFGQGVQQMLDGKLAKGSGNVLESLTVLLLGVPGTAQFFDLIWRAEQQVPVQR